jgi:hypothetical protein
MRYQSSANSPTTGASHFTQNKVDGQPTSFPDFGQKTNGPRRIGAGISASSPQPSPVAA